MKTPLLWTIAAVCLATPAAQARSAYDGSWDLVFVTQGGACHSSYNFTVNISEGVITHPNLVKFRGYVARSGSVRASVRSTINSRPARADFPVARVADDGAATRDVHDAPATGLRNAIDRVKTGEFVRTADLRDGVKHDRAGGLAPVCSRSDHGKDGCRCGAPRARARRGAKGTAR
jgi:hypothetical protein